MIKSKLRDAERNYGTAETPDEMKYWQEKVSDLEQELTELAEKEDEQENKKQKKTKLKFKDCAL